MIDNNFYSEKFNCPWKIPHCKLEFRSLTTAIFDTLVYHTFPNHLHLATMFISEHGLRTHQSVISEADYQYTNMPHVKFP